MEGNVPKRRKIAVDFDDVLIDFYPTMMEFFNSRENTSFKKEDLTSFIINDLWDWDEEEAKENILNFYKIERDFDIKPIKGSIDAIKKIKENNDLVIITGRPHHTLPFMKEWLEKNYNGVFEDIYFTNYFYGGKKTKSEICNEIGAEIIIDDSLIFIQNAAEHGIQGFLLDTPWNQGDLPKNVNRFYSWDEIVGELEG